MGVAVLALIVANSPLGRPISTVLKTYVLGLSVLHWINDGLMAVFFLLVGLEIKREMLDGQLSTWPRRLLPGLAALGGMVVPALDLCGDQLRATGRAARLGHSGRDRHRLRSRRSRLSRQPRADLAEDLSDRARHPRRSRRHPDHRALLHRATSRVPMLAAAGVCLAALVALNWAGCEALCPTWFSARRSGSSSCNRASTPRWPASRSR